MTNADTVKLKAEIQELDQHIDARLASILARLENLAKTEKEQGLGEDLIELRGLCQLRSLKKSLERKLVDSTTDIETAEAKSKKLAT